MTIEVSVAVTVTVWEAAPGWQVIARCTPRPDGAHRHFGLNIHSCDGRRLASYLVDIRSISNLRSISNQRVPQRHHLAGRAGCHLARHSVAERGGRFGTRHHRTKLFLYTSRAVAPQVVTTKTVASSEPPPATVRGCRCTPPCAASLNPCPRKAHPRDTQPQLPPASHQNQVLHRGSSASGLPELLASCPPAQPAPPTQPAPPAHNLRHVMTALPVSAFCSVE